MDNHETMMKLKIYESGELVNEYPNEMSWNKARIIIGKLARANGKENISVSRKDGNIIVNIRK